jgi:Uma2 family endonuclease
MTALVDEESVVAQETVEEDLDQVVWQAWKAMRLPEGYHAEIIEGSIEVSPTGRRRHAVLANRLRRALDAHLAGTPYAAYQDTNVIHGFKSVIPDVFVGPEDLDEAPDAEGLGVDARGVPLVVEVVSPGYDDRKRDRERKRRAYARAGIPVYILIDDHDEDGKVTALTRPEPGHARYAGELSLPYGTDLVVPEGPAKGFVIGEEITRGR